MTTPESPEIVPLSLLLGNDVYMQPVELHFAVTDAAPNAQITFTYDDQTTPFLTSVVNEVGSLRSSLTVNGLSLGEHTLTVSDGQSSDTETFIVEALPVPDPPPVVTFVEPPVPQIVNRWVFQAYDFSSLDSVETYVLPVNPSKVDRGFGDIPLTAEPTTVSNGRVITWEGAPRPSLWTWTGRLLLQDDVIQMARWGTTGQRMYVTDDFGQRYLMKVESLELIRVRDIDRRWHHQYTMRAWALAGAGVVR